MHASHLRRPALLAAIAAVFVVMPFVYPDGPGKVETVATPAAGVNCTIEYRQGLGIDNWYPVEVCE